MATPTSSGINYSGKGSTNFPGVIREIEEAAYLMLYETTLLPKLFKAVGQGAKGGMVHIPYFNPTAIATAGSVLTETNDFTNYRQLVNASIIIYASEFGICSLLTDVTKESSSFNFKDELARQQAIGVGRSLELHCLNTFTSFGTTASVRATSSTEGLTFSAIAAAKTKLDAQLLSVPGSEKNLVINSYGYFYTAKSTYSTTYAAVMPSVGDAVLDKFYITTVFGDVRVFRSNYVTASSVSTGAMFVKDAIGLWTPRDYRIEPERDSSKRADEFTSTMRAGAKVMIEPYGVLMKYYGSAPTAAAW